MSSSTGSQVPSGMRPALRRADFLLATRDGLRVNGAHFLVFIRDRNDERGPRLGITVTRKVGNAVFRNRIKRLVREWFRLRQTRFGSRDLVVIAHRGIPRELTLARVEQDLSQVLEQLCELPAKVPRSP